MRERDVCVVRCGGEGVRFVCIEVCGGGREMCV